MNGLGRREQELLVFFRAHVKAHGFSPSYDEMAVAIGVRSKSSVNRVVDRLVWGGFLKRIPYITRGLAVAYTHDYHSPDCDCPACTEARYRHQLQFVQALKVRPPVAILRARPTNFIPLSDTTRADLIGVDARGPAPRKRMAGIPQGAR